MIFCENDIVLKGINNQYDKITRFACEANTYRRLRSWKILSSHAIC